MSKRKFSQLLFHYFFLRKIFIFFTKSKQKFLLGFLAIIFIILAKIGVTPIFAQQAYCGANASSISETTTYDLGDIMFGTGLFYCFHSNYDNCGKFLSEQCQSIQDENNNRAVWVVHHSSAYTPLEKNDDVIREIGANQTLDGVCGECKFSTQPTVSLYYCINGIDGQCSFAPRDFESLAACEATYGHCFIQCPGGPGSVVPKCNESAGGDQDSDPFEINLSVNKLKFQSLLDMNPLRSSSVFSDPDSRTPGNIINQALTAVVFPIAGVGLLILILLGGFQVLSGSLGGKQNSIDLGKKRVTAAIIGFTLLFLVYWIWRLIALATGLST